MKKTYSEQLKDPRWQKKRLEIMKRDKWKCKLCGDEETTLNVHHKEYGDGNAWEIENEFLVTVCEHCHTEIEHYKKEEDGIIFSDIKVYKSNNWDSGHRIMFFSDSIMCKMRIFDSNDKLIIGFELYSDIPKIVKILKYSI